MTTIMPFPVLYLFTSGILSSVKHPCFLFTNTQKKGASFISLCCASCVGVIFSTVSFLRVRVTVLFLYTPNAQENLHMLLAHSKHLTNVP